MFRLPNHALSRTLHAEVSIDMLLHLPAAASYKFMQTAGPDSRHVEDEVSGTGHSDVVCPTQRTIIRFLPVAHHSCHAHVKLLSTDYLLLRLPVRLVAHH